MCNQNGPKLLNFHCCLGPNFAALTFFSQKLPGYFSAQEREHETSGNVETRQLTDVIELVERTLLPVHTGTKISMHGHV